MWVLGVNTPPAGIHDASACLVDGRGQVIAFSEEERFSRDRHSLYRGPVKATEFCLRMAGITPADVDIVAVGWDVPQLLPDAAFDASEFLAEALGWETAEIRAELVFVPHHLAHATCAFHASPYEDAAVLVVDGNGERESTSIWKFSTVREPKLVRAWPMEQSLGHAYVGACRWLGFSVFDGGKTMGLAAYGRAARLEVPSLVALDDADYRLLLDLPHVPDGATRLQALNRQNRMIGRAWKKRFAELVGARGPAGAIDGLEQDARAVRVAYTAQVMVEETVEWLAAEARRSTGLEQLCLAGGVALNCSSNGRLGGAVYVPPVPHDGGVSLGAAWHVSPPAAPNAPLSPYLGASPEPPSLEALRSRRLRSVPFGADLIVERLLEGAIGAVVEGRAEAGPRALGHRSMLALPTAGQNDRVNLIKHRERWRPFGPIALRETAADLWAPQEHLSRYMVGASPMTERGLEIAPAAAHIDGTTRPQTIGGDTVGPVADVLRALEAGGEPGVLLNTSFNDRGQPIVNNTSEALEAYQAMRLDFLILDDQILFRAL